MEKHRHKWKIYYQKSIGLMTCHTYEECFCGALRDYFENPCGRLLFSKTKVKIRPDFYKKQGKDLI